MVKICRNEESQLVKQKTHRREANRFKVIKALSAYDERHPCAFAHYPFSLCSRNPGNHTSFSPQEYFLFEHRPGDATTNDGGGL